MGKHKKTKAQKKLADIRHENEHTTPPAIDAPTFPEPVSYTFTSSVKTHATTQYSLTHGLEKTLIVSFAIILMQLLLFILLHNHTLVIPLVSIRY